MMKILFNFSFIKAGGGQNVALNFLSSVDLYNNNYFYLVAKNSLIHDYLRNANIKNFEIVSNNPIKRIIWEILNGKRLVKKYKIQLIYSYFGYSFFPKNIPQVIGAADSNLFFPEINFWKEYRGFPLIRKKMIDKYKIYGLKNANGIVFENKLLEMKCKDLFKINAKTTTILPSINLNYNQVSFDFNKKHSLKSTKRGLFLCGWQLHKGIMLIPKIASFLKKKGILFNFILTAPKDMSKIHLEFESLIEKYDVREYISIIGPVNKIHLKSLYNHVDLVFLLSTLESFSNNIIEAWTYKKPLLISNEEWAKELCGDSAFYLERNNPKLISESIINILKDNEAVQGIIKKGYLKLSSFPTIDNKTSLELNFLKTIFKINV